MLQGLGIYTALPALPESLQTKCAAPNYFSVISRVKTLVTTRAFCTRLSITCCSLPLSPYCFIRRSKTFWERPSKAAKRAHRIMGYVYVVAVMIGAPIAIPLAARVDAPSIVAAAAVQAFGWMLCTGIALYCIRKHNLREHRRWMIRGYPFAMVFTVARLVIPIPPILRSGFVGIDIVVWTSIALAAFLPSVILDLPFKQLQAPSKAFSQYTPARPQLE